MLFMEKDTMFIPLLTLNSSLVNMLDFGLLCEVPNSLCAMPRSHKYMTLIAYISGGFITSKSKFLEPVSFHCLFISFREWNASFNMHLSIHHLCIIFKMCTLGQTRSFTKKIAGKKHTVKCPAASKIASCKSWYKNWRTKLCQ